MNTCCVPGAALGTWKQWPLRQNACLPCLITYCGWHVLQTRCCDGDRLREQFFWVVEILLGRSQERSHRGGDMWSGVWRMREGGREFLPRLKGLDRACSGLWSHLKTSGSCNSYRQWQLWSSSFASAKHGFEGACGGSFKSHIWS